MSFVNMYASDIWSEADILTRTEEMISSMFSRQAEDILNRKATGAALGQYVLTSEDQMELQRYETASVDARLAGVEARADMALLREVLAIEAANKRLAMPVVEAVLLEPSEFELIPVLVLNQAELDEDAAERLAAQVVVSNASDAANSLTLLRNPPSVIEEEVLFNEIDDPLFMGSIE